MQGRREKALSEVARLLRPGGRACVYVWALEQEKDRVKSKYLRPSKSAAGCQPGISPRSTDAKTLPVHVNGTAFQAQDIFVPWHLKEVTGSTEHDQLNSSTRDDAVKQQIVHRYYHTFVDGELQRLCSNVAGVNNVESYYDQGNWCVIVERTY